MKLVVILSQFKTSVSGIWCLLSVCLKCYMSKSLRLQSTSFKWSDSMLCYPSYNVEKREVTALALFGPYFSARRIDWTASPGNYSSAGDLGDTNDVYKTALKENVPVFFTTVNWPIWNMHTFDHICCVYLNSWNQSRVLSSHLISWSN